MNKEQFEHAAKYFLHTLVPHTQASILALRGDLGAGKTTFVQTIAHELGVKETVTSPTFVIMKKYPLTDQVFKSLIHVDAYRLKDSHELKVLGWDELVANPSNLICIEWPESVGSLIPPVAHNIIFTFVDEHTRLVEYG